MPDDRAGLCPPPNRFRLARLCRGAALLGLICLPLWASAQEKPAKPEETTTGLPPGYHPPPDPPEIMLIEKTLLSPEEKKQFFRDLNRKTMKRLRNGDLRDEAARTDVRNGILYYLNEITIASQRSAPLETRKQLGDIRRKFTGNGFAAQAGVLVEKPPQVIEFRRKFLQMVVAETEQLFDNNYYARLQAALILGELNLVEEDAAHDVRAQAFAPASKPLCKVLLDPEQPEGVKIVCVLSLVRIMRQGNPNVDQKRDIGMAMVSELKRTDTTAWYQTRLAEALGYNDVPLDLDREPFIFNSLMSVLRDKDGKRDLRTRVQAAWSLGRIPLERTMDVSQLTLEVAALAHDLAVAQTANPKKAGWRRCAWVLYLAFERKDDHDLPAKRNEDRKGGLLNNPVTRVDAEEAFQQVIPIIREVYAEKLVAPEQVQELTKWLQAKGFRLADAKQPNK